MATTGKARAVNNLSPVQGAVHTRKDVAAQFVPKKARSTRRQHSIVSAMADFDSDSPSKHYLSLRKTSLYVQLSSNITHSQL